METFSVLLALCAGNSLVNGEFPAQRPVTRKFDVFCDLCLHKRLGKQKRHRWFEMPSRSLWYRYIMNVNHACYRRHFIAATKQLYDWFSPSVRLSVCLSVRPSVTPFSPCSHHRIIMKFSGVITMVRSGVHAEGQGQRSKVKVTEVNTQLSGFRTLTPVWIHIWQWNHAHSWKQHRRGALLFFKVIRQISRSHGSKNSRIWPRLGVSGL